MKKSIVVVVFILFSSKIFGSDSVYIKFINKSIDLSEYGYYSKITVNKNFYLFVKEGDHEIHCFIFRKNQLVEAGLLKMEKPKDLIALRNGYWKTFKRSKIIKIYYDDDEPVIEKNNIPRCP